MSFFSLIFIAVLIYFLLPIFKGIIKIWKASHQIKKQFGNFGSESPFGSYSSGNSTDYDAPRRESKSRNRRRRSKIFSSQDGEYVQFEEVIEERNLSFDSSSDLKPEPRITDVKFEDIKD